MRTAITRAVSPRIGECELTWLDREPIDALRAVRQHEEYERVIARCGWRVLRADPLPDSPDGVFVEDTAVVLSEIAVLTRPGAESRRSEVESIGRILDRLRPVARIEPPGTLDGGDVLQLGRTIYVGVGGRTNAAGAAAFASLVEPLGYEVRETAFSGCLHLQTAATAIGTGAVLLNPAWVDPGVFEASIIEADPLEPEGANALVLGEQTLLLSAAAPRTRARLERHGYRVVPVEITELEKAEAGVTCCSILVR